VLSTDLVVTDGIVTLTRDGVNARVDILYLRIAEETLLHATGADGRPLGPALLGAVDRGTLALVNAPGNGVGDDKAVYAYVGELIEYYLGEQQLLADVATYLCGDRDHLDHVLPRLAELVIKPVDGYGGEGVLIGPHATEEELAVTERQVRAAPHRWVAQEMVELSTLPTFDGTSLVPRHVDLRAFVLTGDRTQVLPVALTRVAPSGSIIVNSSRGGGSKDTWLLAEPAR
jgi:carboxylate-amine ligase